MRRARRGRKTSKHISISATDADWEIVRRNADRRSLSIARYLVELVERGRFGRERRSCAGVHSRRAAGASGGGTGSSRADGGGGGNGSPGARHTGADHGDVRRLGVCDGWVHLGGIGSRILGTSPDFDPRTYGCPKPEHSGHKVRRIRSAQGAGHRGAYPPQGLRPWSAGQITRWQDQVKHVLYWARAAHGCCQLESLRRDRPPGLLSAGRAGIGRPR